MPRFGDDEDEAIRALQAARRFAHAGNYADALERHEWYHHNALRIDEASNYGVRLSTALSLWKELADQYPPALDSLKATRDAALEELEAGTGSTQSFHDIVSINEQLGEETATVALFKTLAGKHPALARKCFLYARDTLINQGEIELFLEHGGELVRYLEDQIRLHKEIVKMIKFTTARHERKDSIKESDDDLVETTLQLVALATRQGDTATVTRLKALAFKRVPDPRIRP